MPKNNLFCIDSPLKRKKIKDKWKTHQGCHTKETKKVSQHLDTQLETQLLQTHTEED